MRLIGRGGEWGQRACRSSFHILGVQCLSRCVGIYEDGEAGFWDGIDRIHRDVKKKKIQYLLYTFRFIKLEI